MRTSRYLQWILPLLLAAGATEQATAAGVIANGGGVVPAGMNANDIEIFYTIGAGVGLVPIATGNPLSNTSLAGAGAPVDTPPGTLTPGHVTFSSPLNTPGGTNVAWNLLIDPAVTITDWYFTENGADIDTGYAGAPGNYGPASVVYTAVPAPEPLAWTLMLGGLGIAGGALRMRRGRPASI